MWKKCLKGYFGLKIAVEMLKWTSRETHYFLLLFIQFWSGRWKLDKNWSRTRTSNTTPSKTISVQIWTGKKQSFSLAVYFTISMGIKGEAQSMFLKFTICHYFWGWDCSYFAHNFWRFWASILNHKIVLSFWSKGLFAKFPHIKISARCPSVVHEISARCGQVRTTLVPRYLSKVDI